MSRSLPPRHFFLYFQFVCSITQLLLILGISTSWGIPNLLFASGDEAASNVVLALQFLPITRMWGSYFLFFNFFKNQTQKRTLAS